MQQVMGANIPGPELRGAIFLSFHNSCSSGNFKKYSHPIFNYFVNCIQIDVRRDFMSKKFPDLRFLLFLACIFVLLPLVFFHSTLDPGLVPRYFITSICLSVFFLAYFIIPSKEAVNLHLPGKIILLFCIQQVWMLITIFWSINSGDAVQEWLRTFSFVLFFILSLVILSSQSNSIAYLVRSTFIAIFIFSVYGMMQLYPLLLDYFQKSKPLVIDLTICSSLSNKNFFAEVITILLPFQFYGVRKEKGTWLVLSWTSLSLCIFWIILLQTVSSWLAILIGCLLMLVLARITRTNSVVEKKGISVRSIFLRFGLVCIVLGTVFFLYSKSRNFSYLEKKVEMVKLYWTQPNLFYTTSNANNNSIYERIIVWKNSLKLIEEHPLTGAGLNNWKLLQAKFGVGGTIYLNTGMVHFEHPHNDYLLVWSEQGIPGILLFLLFFFMVLRQTVKSLRNTRDPDKRTILLLATMAICSFMVLSFFGYPRSRYFVMLLLMIWVALVYFLSEDDSRPKSIHSKWNRKIYLVCFILSGTTLVASWHWLSGEIHLRRAQVYQLKKNYSRMMREAQLARSWLYTIDGTTTPIIWYEGMANFYNGNIPAARSAFEQAEKVNPYHLRVLNDLATTYEQSGMRDKAIAHYKSGLSITPLFIEGLLNLSAAYFNIHQPDSALEVIGRIPEMKMSYRDQKNYSSFLPAILYAVAAKDTVKIEDGLERSKYLNFLASDTLLVNAYNAQRKGGDEFNTILLVRFRNTNLH